MQTAEIKVKAICVRAVPYRESDMIVTLVGVETGKITASVRGCLKKGAKLRYAAEPLNFGDYVLVGKSGKYVVTECSQIDSFNAVTADIDRYYAACMTLNTLEKLCEEAQPRVMLAALRALNDLAYSDNPTDRIETDFLLKVLEESGISLDFANCNVCKCSLESVAYFNNADGIVCAHCKAYDALPIDAISRAYIAGEGYPSHSLRVKANILLCELVYNMLGVRIGTQYFTEQL